MKINKSDRFEWIIRKFAEPFDRFEQLQKTQPTAKGVEDKIKWCIEFLRRHGYKVEKPWDE